MEVKVYMLALSVRQPWAFWIATLGVKRYENRNWDPSYLKAQLERCPIGSNFLIHAAKGLGKTEYYAALEFAAKRCGTVKVPPFDDLKKGGIIGMVRLAGVVKESKDPWFIGPIALKLEDPCPLPFVPCQGALGFFDVTLESVQQSTE